MKCRNILTVTTLTGAAMTASAMAQTTIYTCNFDNPPYTVGSIDTQQGWLTVQGAALAPGLSSMAISATAGSLAPQAGNGCFSSESGTSSTNSSRFAVQSGAGAPIVAAINTACAANATSIEFSCYVVPPTPSTVGTTSVTARHGMTLYVTDATGVPSKAAVGFQCRAFDSRVYVMQWLDVGQRGAFTAGNYLIPTQHTLTAGTWNAVGCKWLRDTGLPQIKINAGEWTDVVATSTIGYVAKEFDVFNFRGSTSVGQINTVSTVAYMDTLVIAAVQPHPQCNASAGSCNVAHLTGGCNLVSCCEAVCGLLPSCCDIGWDQGCVDIAIPECGLWVYNCSTPNTPANNCAISPQEVNVTATPVGFAFNTTTATTDGPPEPRCNSGNNDTPIHKDVWYRFIAPTDGTLTATNCFAGNFDSKIAAYDIGTNLAAFDPQLLPDYFIGCNEDCTDPAFTSELSVSGIVAGHYYLVRLGGYMGASGIGSISISVAPTDADGDGRPDATDNCPDIANWTQADCNNDGIGDVCEIASGNPDFNLDTIPDSCQCLADLFVDGKVSGADLGVLLSQWGPAPAGTVSDINRDGQVSGADLGFLLNAWGPCSN